MTNNILFFGGSSLLASMWVNIVEDKSKIYLTQHKKKITLDKANIINIKEITFEGVNKILKENKIDILINCVGLTNVEKCCFR